MDEIYCKEIDDVYIWNIGSYDWNIRQVDRRVNKFDDNSQKLQFYSRCNLATMFACYNDSNEKSEGTKSDLH